MSPSRTTDLVNNRIKALKLQGYVNEGSVSELMRFISDNKITKKPSISVNRQGHVNALWRESKDELVEIVFNPDRESKIVTFSSEAKKVLTAPINEMIQIINDRKLLAVMKHPCVSSESANNRATLNKQQRGKL